MATEAGVKHLVLTHLQPWSDPLEVWAQARTTWDGQLSLAQPGALYQV